MILIVSFVTLLLSLAYFGWKSADVNLLQLKEAKASRTTSGIVTGKRYIRFTDTENFYIDDQGKRRDVTSGTELGLVYYQIDNLDQLSESKRSELLAQEKARTKDYGPRLYVLTQDEKLIYDKVNVGDKLAISYYYIGGDVVTIGVRNLTLVENNVNK